MKWGDIGARLAPLVASAANGVERHCVGVNGKAKQDAALAVFDSMVHSVEAPGAAALLHDPRVDAATRALIDAYICWQNALAAAAEDRM